jgi:hypothetical protein
MDVRSRYIPIFKALKYSVYDPWLLILAIRCLTAYGVKALAGTHSTSSFAPENGNTRGLES